MEQLAAQVESQYCYAMLKLKLMGQLENENPDLTCLLKGY